MRYLVALTLLVAASAQAQDTPVELTSEGVALEEPIRFDIEHDTIRPECFPALEALAALVVAHPERGVLRIEGHMSEETWREREHMSNRLWLRRAEAVLAFLMAHGVPRERLVADARVTDAPVCDPGSVRGPRRRRACRQRNDRIVLRWE